MDARIVSALVFWSHSGAYLIAIPVVAVSIAAVIRNRRELARELVANDADLTQWHRRRVALWSAAGLAGLLAFGAGVGHIGCAYAKSSQAQCASNLKHLALALLMYAQDYDERYPPADRWADIPQLRGRDAALRCPAARSSYGYAMNDRVGCVRYLDLWMPFEVILLFEADANRRSSSGGRSDLVMGRHMDGSIQAFCDGHVKWMPEYQVTTLRWDPSTLDKRLPDR